MPFLFKPTSPTWRPSRAPAGCRLYLPFAEGVGPTVRDAAGGCGKNGTFVGTPAWQTGYHGPQLGGFSTSNYLAIDPPTQVLGSVYPSWMALLFVGDGGNGYSAFQGSSTSSTPFFGLQHPSGGGVVYQARDNAGTIFTLQLNAAGVADGQPHVLMGGSYAPNDHRLFLDGRQRLTSPVILTALVNDRLTIGAARSSSVSSPFAGSTIQFAAGNGSVPDPMALASDWLRGEFAADASARHGGARRGGARPPAVVHRPPPPPVVVASRRPRVVGAVAGRPLAGPATPLAVRRPPPPVVVVSRRPRVVAAGAGRPLAGPATPLAAAAPPFRTSWAAGSNILIGG